MFWFFIPMIILVATVQLPLFLTFDQLVKHQHVHFQNEWTQDGRPSGFFWRATWRSYSARNRVMTKWIWRVAPDWIRNDHRATALRKRFQILTVIWFVCLPFALGASGLLAVLHIVFGII